VSGHVLRQGAAAALSVVDMQNTAGGHAGAPLAPMVERVMAA